jgi:small subunit ribosomal protein S1
VISVDSERKRVALGLKQLSADPWAGDIPDRYHPGAVKQGKVTKLTNFGVFVELEPGLEGLLHLSELADHKVGSPEEVVQVGDLIEVRVLRVDPGDRKIALSRKQASQEKGETVVEGEGRGNRPRDRELRGGTGPGAGQVFNLPAGVGGDKPGSTPTGGG